MTREWYITHFGLQISCILESMADSWLVISGIDKAQFSYLACLSSQKTKASVPRLTCYASDRPSKARPGGQADPFCTCMRGCPTTVHWLVNKKFRCQ